MAGQVVQEVAAIEEKVPGQGKQLDEVEERKLPIGHVEQSVEPRATKKN